MKKLFPSHLPMGQGLGIYPGRVVWIHDRKSVDWKENCFWWNLDNFDEDKILNMVRTGLMLLTNSENPTEAWEKLFRDFNKRRGLNRGYRSEEKIAVKVNMNGSGEWGDDFSGNSHMDYTNPILIKAFLRSLVEDAKIPSENVTFFDSIRIFPDYFREMCDSEELKKVNFTDRSNVEIDKNRVITWSHSFSNTKNYLPTCLTESDYLINLASLKGHYFGVTLLAKNHFGTFINYRPDRGPEAANLHRFLISGKIPEYSPLVDLLGNKEIGDKTLLYAYDALICAQTEGSNLTKSNTSWKQDPFNSDQTKSLFFSQDPLALDSVGIDLLSNEPTVRNHSGLNNNRAAENYLHEGSSLENPASGIRYQNGYGEEIKNLGVHEHWNNSKDKKYSRNLGEDEGIELIYHLIN